MTASTATTFGDLVTAYLDSRSPGALERLHQAIVTDPTFDPDLDLSRPSAALRDGRVDDAVADVSTRMPGAFFSPSAHALLAAAFGALDDRRQERELTLWRAALDAIRDSGDGSESRPWVVMRVSDEYDLLRSLDRSAKSQSLVRTADAQLDRIELDDGSQVHFRLR